MKVGMGGRVLAVTSGLALAVAVGVTGCPTSADPEASPVDGGARPIGDDAAAARADARAAEDPDPIPPEGLPPGWVRWDGAGKMCKFYVPAGPENLPKSLHWVECPSGGSLPGGAVCRLLDVDWTSKGALHGLTSWMQRGVDEAGVVRFAIGREEAGFYRREIIREDGAVEQAFLEGDKSFCAIYPINFRGERYAYGFKGSEGSGIVSGLASSRLPDHVVRRAYTESHGPYVTPFGILDLGPGHVMTLFPPGVGLDGGVLLWSAAKDDGLQQGLITATDDAVFWKASNEVYGKQRVYTPGGGVRALRDFGTDYTRRDFDLGTDGHDLVWIFGSERTQPSGRFPKLEVMAAPYTTNPQMLAPRRIRSFQGDVGAEATLVGCGYALHGEGLSSTLVRLADGMAWRIPADSVTGGVQWAQPIAVTCDEVFGLGYLPASPSRPTTLVRVRIDSLGPGSPPD